MSSDVTLNVKIIEALLSPTGNNINQVVQKLLYDKKLSTEKFENFITKRIQSWAFFNNMDSSAQLLGNVIITIMNHERALEFPDDFWSYVLTLKDIFYNTEGIIIFNYKNRVPLNVEEYLDKIKIINELKQ